jgi:uncharacterized protein YndB with AHSA1/START domain
MAEVQKHLAVEPLVVSRLFPAPRRLVFRAWSTAEHLKRWFSPENLTVPHAEVEFRAGGACNICMRTADGQEHWSQGTFLEVEPYDRLVVKFLVGDPGAPQFTAHTTVTFADEGHGTRMTVDQRFDVHDAAGRFAVEGASEGWRTTLDKLSWEVERLKDGNGERSVTHDTFSLERIFAAAPAKVFRAFTEPAAKALWFGGGGFDVLERSMDIRPRGRERLQGRWPSGVVTTFDAVYLDVLDVERLIYAYEMHLDARKISASLATLQFKAHGTGTRLTVTEQGSFLDGYDDAGSRAKGTADLLDRVAAALGSMPD